MQKETGGSGHEGGSERRMLSATYGPKAEQQRATWSAFHLVIPTLPA